MFIRLEKGIYKGESLFFRNICYGHLLDMTQCMKCCNWRIEVLARNYMVLHHFYCAHFISQKRVHEFLTVYSAIWLT